MPKATDIAARRATERETPSDVTDQYRVSDDRGRGGGEGTWVSRVRTQIAPFAAPASRRLNTFFTRHGIFPIPTPTFASVILGL